MANFEYRSGIEERPERVFAWHGRPGAFERLIPAWVDLQLVRRGTLDVGSTWEMVLKKGPLTSPWTAEIVEIKDGEQFVDTQREGPFKSWTHTHQFKLEARRFCLLEDHIDFELSGLGRMFGAKRATDELTRLFRFRHERTRHDVMRHKNAHRFGPRRIAITGASGLIGTQLAHFLTGGGHDVVRLVRGKPRGDGEVFWDPAKREIDAVRLEGLDAVIHLAGESVGEGRWTDERRHRIRDSRVEGTRFLAETLARLEKKPPALLAASAIGYYGDRGGEEMTEDSGPGEGFLPSVGVGWENATAPAAEAGIRVVNLRIGVVMTFFGAALPRIVSSTRFGASGKIGSGDQWVSWVSLDDLIGAIHYCLFRDISGPVNVVSPNPVQNRDLAKTVRGVLGRRGIFPAPAFAVKALFGAQAEELLLSSTKARPARLLDAGFRFTYRELIHALTAELGVMTPW